MAKTKVQKKAIVAEYVTKLKASPAVLFIRPSGLNANETVELKKELRGNESQYSVIKNTLFALALKSLDMPEVAELAAGANAVVYTGENYVQAAKIVKEASKKYEEKIVSTVGILDGALLSEQQMKDLADMPSLEVIISQIAGILTNPVAGVANVLEDSVRSYVSILDQAFKSN